LLYTLDERAIADMHIELDATVCYWSNAWDRCRYSFSVQCRYVWWAGVEGSVW